MMNASVVILSYFNNVKEKSGWDTFFSEDVLFVSPTQKSVGKSECVAAAGRFFRMVTSLEIKTLIAEGNTVCAWVKYSLLKNGKYGECLVAELLEVRDGKIISFSIMFDTLALKSFTTSDS